jgi:hypothetical protein
MSELDKYDLYTRAVQRPADEARFFRELFRELKGAAPKRLREDFCGTFGVCCEWVKLGPEYRAYGRDLGREPLQYGSERNLTRLTPEQRSRVKIERRDSLAPGGPSCDLALALNFSYFTLKDRALLKRYLVNARKGLRRGGVLAMDAFGGAGAHRPNREKTDHGAFVYYWEQYGFDPVSYEARCAMHFKPRGRRKVRDVFTYDWRLWTIAETRDLMAEAGFRRSSVYWQGDDGRFARDANGGREEVWVALIVAEK